MQLIQIIAIVTVLALAFVRVATGSLTCKQASQTLICLAATEFALCMAVSFPFDRGGIGSNAAILLVAAAISAVTAAAAVLMHLDQPTPAVQRSRHNRQQRARHN